MLRIIIKLKVIGLSHFGAYSDPPGNCHLNVKKMPMAQLHRCLIWAQNGQIGPWLGQIRDPFRSDFSMFWLGEPICTEIWSENLGPFRPNLSPNLTSVLVYQYILARPVKNYSPMCLKMCRGYMIWHWLEQN